MNEYKHVLNERISPINGYDGLYSITDLGRVISHGRIRSNGSPRHLNPKILSQRMGPPESQSRYPRVSLCDANGIPKDKYVHRLVAEAFIPNPENKKEVNHIDGNKKNNAVSNLEWVTRLENNTHAITVLGVIPGNNNVAKGEKNHLSKIKAEDVIRIRETRNSVYASVWAKRLGITKANVIGIRNRRSWKHISP